MFVRRYQYVLLMMMGVTASVFAQEPKYRYALIQVESLGATNEIAASINNLGHIVGNGDDPVTRFTHAFFWDGEKTIDLGTLGGDRSWAFDINDSDEIVGVAQQGGIMYRRAFFWKNGAMIDLLSQDDCLAAVAYGINNSGQITGECAQPGDNFFDPFLWTDGKLIMLPVNRNPDVPADHLGRDINELGMVAGRTDPPSLVNLQACVWDVNGEPHYLGSLGDGNQYSEAIGINDSGIVVGQSHVTNPGNPFRAFIFNKGRMKNLTKPFKAQGFKSAGAWSINNSNQIVGSMSGRDDGESVLGAVIWEEGKGLEGLNAMLPPNNKWWLDSANDINDHGQICARGYDKINHPEFEIRSFLLTPVEPELVLDAGDGPLVAGVVNELKVTGAEVGAEITFVYGKVGGGARIDGCSDLDAMLQIDDVHTIGTAVADENGVAVIKSLINPNASSLKGRLLQAYDGVNCQESQLIQKRIE